MNVVKSIIGLLLLMCFSLSLYAQDDSQTYYPQELTDHPELQNQELKLELNKILKQRHQKVPGGADIIVDSCALNSKCYSHVSAGYGKAKTFILANFNLQQNSNGYEMKDVYCEKEYDIPAPNVLPDSTVLNVEHTWPQSRFTSQFSNEMQKSDMHHLFPSDSQLNSIRGNFWFGEVVQDKKILKCVTSRFGYAQGGGSLVFQPPTEHRGNVARALFYFAVRYHMPIDAKQEVFLREWNKQDPVDAQEMDRNNEIFKLQGNRNPFVDMPELADRIQDF